MRKQKALIFDHPITRSPDHPIPLCLHVNLYLMAVKVIQLGQVWRNDESGDIFLVTKLYSELFTQYAMLRPASFSAPEADTVRVKVSKTPEGVTLPGYTFTQDSQEF